ncbi:MAG: glycogen/starch/alpha-glucan phosphorylase [Lachnospiraceae bacterium]|nr:glycogen/starch/alpha-glucan phosphorylase [Lachnospiraceae bacterium]MDD6448433.1 glycogen/starch/alpha-glucan phosphorylase [Lachnospiraceae bacterium]MDD6578082.1 glycogen/starch/alpha-glucan phosphorylase [Lachnospiraceae bacterium]
MEEKINQLLKDRCGKDLDNCSKEELFDVLMQLTKEKMAEEPAVSGDKKLYYISAEFLIGKLLSNNLINLGLYDEINEILKKHGKEIADIEEIEPEPSLGNGGLGRLAACFLDSIASLNLPGDGVGLNYHYGLFQQKFENHLQHEVKNPWITKDSWLTRREDVHFEVPFRKATVTSSLYDIAVPGYETGKVNQLHLFDLDSVNDQIVGEDSIDFDKTDIKENLTLFLYPDDSDDNGRLLRVYQEYFMVSNAAQLILMECKEKGYDLHELDKHVAIQINDTHPSMVIPELIRLLQKEGFTMDEAIDLVTKTCAYTNHTILAEALETWPMSYMEAVVPHLLPIIRELDNRVRSKVTDRSTYIIDDENRVHMAFMDIHYGHSVNGVAKLHTEILENSELHNFYKLYPEKFNNKTNGITFRRWLVHCNPELASYITSLIGDDYKKDAMKLQDLMKYVDDPEVLKKLGEIKHENKVRLAEYMKANQGLTIDPDSIFDVQVKRLHEYKRQQMNCLYAIHKYLEIKAGKKPSTPITMIFGAKAAPAYVIAKDIIHLILCLQDLTANDPEVAPYFRLVMAENYNVTYAGKIIPAAEISEQISLASKEASGTSNMKFMLNGAVTLGTEDGANVEIHQLVGDDNIYIFGKDADTVVKLYAESGYHPGDYYKDPEIKELVDFIVGDELRKIGNAENLERLHHELISKDWFMTLLDLKEYIKVKDQVYEDYKDQKAWNRKALVNIAHAGFFSSDRTIAQYNDEIWKLK